jgi:hypothetical protein
MFSVAVVVPDCKHVVIVFVVVRVAAADVVGSVAAMASAVLLCAIRAMPLGAIRAMSLQAAATVPRRGVCFAVT